ncbi:response regulator transcription factor [Devosia chinhatensis]|uniref:response regulator transcription factor n=1 Tax=Devosia chinhatensis TaxID=429727 RepID=UPI0006971D14|nr:response regulator transcription factor [Devosia chinhatensis]
MQDFSITCYVLDDDPAVNEVICGILGRNGVDFESFLSLDALLRAMASTHPDLIFLDVRLKDADAVEAVRQLHAIGYRGKIQVVSGLGAAQLSEIYRLLERYGYGSLYPIAKPFRSAAIKAALSHLSEGPAISPPPRPAAGLVSAWLASTRGESGIMVAQPSLLAAGQGTDLFASRQRFDEVIDQVRLAWSAARPGRQPQAWLHMTAGAALALPLGSLSAWLSDQQSLNLGIVVPATQMLTTSSQVDDLRTRLLVYGFRVGLLTTNLHDISLNSLVRITGGCLVLGEHCIAEILGNPIDRALGENILAACRNKSISVAALYQPGVEEQNDLIALGIEWLAAPLDAMVPLVHLPQAPRPQFGPTQDQDKPEDAGLPDFPGRDLLSQREYEIVNLTANGFSAKEAGRELGLSHRTVEVHRSNVFAKLGVKNVAQLTRLVLGLR